jgi:hypothetical protein
MPSDDTLTRGTFPGLGSASSTPHPFLSPRHKKKTPGNVAGIHKTPKSAPRTPGRISAVTPKGIGGGSPKSPRWTPGRGGLARRKTGDSGVLGTLTPGKSSKSGKKTVGFYFPVARIELPRLTPSLVTVRPLYHLPRLHVNAHIAIQPLSLLRNPKRTPGPNLHRRARKSLRCRFKQPHPLIQLRATTLRPRREPFCGLVEAVTTYRASKGEEDGGDVAGEGAGCPGDGG